MKVLAVRSFTIVVLLAACGAPEAAKSDAPPPAPTQFAISCEWDDGEERYIENLQRRKHLVAGRETFIIDSVAGTIARPDGETLTGAITPDGISVQLRNTSFEIDRASGHVRVTGSFSDQYYDQERDRDRTERYTLDARGTCARIQQSDYAF